MAVCRSSICATVQPVRRPRACARRLFPAATGPPTRISGSAVAGSAGRVTAPPSPRRLALSAVARTRVPVELVGEPLAGRRLEDVHLLGVGPDVHGGALLHR